jgi:hypothetical protein
MSHASIVMRRFALALLVAVASSGCLRSTTTIDLKDDGSGTILQETAVSTQAIGMLQGLAGAQPAGEKPVQLFGEEQARKAADTMGVTFVSGEPYKAGELEGYRARYSFADISKITLKMDQGTNSMAPGSDTKKPPFGFGFKRGSAGSLLTIQMPDQTPGAPGALPFPGGGSDADKAQMTQAMAMMKMMMRGLFVDVALNVDGRILKSNAPFVEGSRVTLLQIDFDKLVADETALLKLQGAKDIKSLSAVPGLKVITEPTVTIEFSR